MKLKRFLALAVSLVMVISMIPVFSITVGAANYAITGTISTTYRPANSSIEHRDGTGSDTNSSHRDLYIYHSNWNQRFGLVGFTMPEIGESEIVKSATLKLYANSVPQAGRISIGSVNNSWNEDTYVEENVIGVPDYQVTSKVTNLNNGFVVYAEQNVNTANQWYEFDITEYVKNFSAGEQISFAATHITKSGETTTGAAINLAFAGRTRGDLAPQLVIETTTKASVTVNYVNANGQILATRTDYALVGDEYTVTNTVNDNYIIVDKTDSENGYVFDLVESETITVAESNNVVNVTVDTIYIIKSANLLPDGEDGISNWTLGAGSTVATVSGKGTIEKSTDKAHSGEHSLKMKVGWESSDGGGWLSDKALALYADVNTNSMYYFAGSVNFGTDYNKNYNGGTEVTIATLSTAKDPASVQGLTNGVAALANGGVTSFNGTSTGDGAGNGKQFGGKNGNWQQLEYVLTTDADSKQFTSIFYYLCDAGTTYFDDFMLYEIEVPATSKEVTATYTVNGNVIESLTKTKIVDTTVTDSATFDEVYYYVDGETTIYYAEAQSLSDSTTIAMSAVENWSEYAIGTEFVYNNTPYKVVGTNLIPNGNFEHGLKGWYNVNGADAEEDKFTVNGDGTITIVGDEPSSGDNTKRLYRSWKVEANKTYAFVMKTDQGNDYHKVGFDTTINRGGDGTVFINGTTAGDNLALFETTEAGYVKVRFRWGYGETVGNFGLYEVEVDESRIANTTIKFVDSSDGTTEIKDAVTVTGIVGDVIDLSAYSSAITHNGNPYSFDSTNETSYTVVGNNDVVTLTYTTDAYVSFEGTAVTVIQGNEPVISATVTAKTGAGSTAVVDGAVWDDATGLSAGTHEISGTVEIDGKEISGTVTVTVLPLTFEVSDLEGVGNVSFPTDVTGDFYIEYDFNASNFDNLWIYHSKNRALWGSGQIGLGWDNEDKGIFRAQNGNGSSGATTVTGNTFATNNTYRFLVHGNVDTDKYDFVVYDTVTKGVVASGDDYGFRTNADVINSIVMANDGQSGNATITNIKVYAPNQADQFTTITVIATGSVSDSYTTTATSIDKLTIPYYEGNILKSRSVDGTTVTFTYEKTETSLGSWAIRNNVVDEAYITEMKYLGTHNSFAYNTTVVENEGGALRNDADGFVILETSHTVPYASSTSTTVINNSRAQTLDALDQLNAGVRYFDIRLTRQEDGTFWVFHGPAFADFRPIAATIAQWAKENPGEVIILDFHYSWDALYGTEYEVVTGNTSYYGETQGDDNQYFYDALVELLKETGLWDHIREKGNGSEGWDVRYGVATDNGTKTAVVALSKNRGANCVDKFVSRDDWTEENGTLHKEATSGDTTYDSGSDFNGVVGTIEDAIEAGKFGEGARFGLIHAYTTPISLGSAGDSLIDAANSNRSSWINEDLKSWMAKGYGDVLIMNNVTAADTTTYLAVLSEINRDYVNGIIGSEIIDYDYDWNDDGKDGLTVEDVTLTGDTASVPFSTEFTVTPTDAEQVVEIDGVTYTTKTVYDIKFMQYDTNEVALNGDVTYTFPMISDGSTTVDALLYNDAVVATADVGNAISYTTSNTGKFVLATKVAPGQEYTVNYVADGTTIYTTTALVPFGQVVYAVPAGDFYLSTGTEAYILNSAAALSHTAASEDTVTEFEVEVAIVSEYAVIADAFHNASDAQPWNNDDNKLFVGSSGVSDAGHLDADNVATTSRGEGQANITTPRIPLITFNVPEVGEKQAVKLNLYVAEINGNLGVGAKMKLAANVSDIEANETTNAVVAGDIANLDGIVWSDTMVTQGSTETRKGVYNCDQWVSIDVTEFVKDATGDTITFTLYAPAAGAYVADREKAVVGGAYQGKAAYLEVVDAYEVEVIGASKITRNGNLVGAKTEVLAYEGAQIKLYETNADTPAFTNGTKVYATDNTTGETPYITVTGADEYFAATVGVAPVNGAQVRIGDGVDENGKVDGTNSGLRFITTVNRDNSLATVTGATFGVEITAEGSSVDPVVIPATLWQTEGEVFTSALTNLAVGNFNRKFTATPYVTADGQTFYGTPVTRSIYQVAAGLLVNNYADGTEYPETALSAKRMIDVLNAYVNQTGIRLTLADTDADEDKELTVRTEGTGTGAYSGAAFFTVSDTTVNGTVYTVTLTPVGANTKINMNYWNTYVRINNNNSQTAVATTLTENEDGTYTLTFDTSAVAPKAE